MIDIIQVKEFQELEPVLISFCHENNLPKEKINEFILNNQNQFNRDDFVYFLVSVDNVSKGFMSCEITEKIIRTHRLFVEKSEKYDEILFQLILDVSKQLESFNKEYLQIFFVNSLKLEKKLVENDFTVFQRVKMVYNLKENQIPEFSLAADYQLANFTLDKLDEELQVVVDANRNHIDGEIFLQFSSLDDLKKLFFSSNMDTGRLRIDSPIILKNGKIIGINIVVNLSETASYIWIIALLSEHRGKGLGKFLMLKSHEDCKKTNVNQMVLDVTKANIAAFNLYKKLGYKETNQYLTVIKKYH
ncbi:MAG: GNAT family N-acetyltransferase [Candidatus Heimdallarchaeota archaeon]|nr:GNAT family N-acetyltransferase [Candidatus Heimdallarchaeota archaeon]